MSLSLPDICLGNEYNQNHGCGGENRILTILLGSKDRIVSYSGILEIPIDSPKDFKYGKEGIRKHLFDRNNQVLQYSAAVGRTGSGITVIIKPSAKSNFRNLVDILDEIKITNIGSYSIINHFTAEESKLLANN